MGGGVTEGWQMVTDIPMVGLGFIGIKNLPGMDPDKSSVVLKQWLWKQLLASPALWKE